MCWQADEAVKQREGETLRILRDQRQLVRRKRQVR